MTKHVNQFDEPFDVVLCWIVEQIRLRSKIDFWEIDCGANSIVGKIDFWEIDCGANSIVEQMWSKLYCTNVRGCDAFFQKIISQ